jgi:predicted dienelactone hydrolase
MRRIKGLIFLFVLLFSFGLAQTSIINSEPGKYKVEIKYLDLKDVSRGREIPLKIYYPKEDGLYPVILFSHGLGGSREGGKYWGEFLASHGFVCIHMQHHGSDSEVLKNSSAGLADKVKDLFSHADSKNLMLRVVDSKYCISRLEELNQNDKDLRGKIDTSKIGFSGHSFGALTTQSMAGQIYTTPRGKEVSGYDNRIKAFIAFSPTMTKNMDAETSFKKIVSPFFGITGDADDVIIIKATADQRRIPFDNMPVKDKYLVTFVGADHASVSGQERWKDKSKDDSQYIRLIKMSTLAFWNAYLKNDDNSLEYLKNQFKVDLGNIGVFEWK